MARGQGRKSVQISEFEVNRLRVIKKRGPILTGPLFHELLMNELYLVDGNGLLRAVLHAGEAVDALGHVHRF